VRYGELGSFLHREGFALHNLASLPHISVAGAVATATHGSGERNGSLATAVRQIELVRPDGEVALLSRGNAGFDQSVISAGAAGVVTRMTLDIEPTFDVAQTVYLDLPLASALEHFDEIQAAGYSVSLFTDWSGGRINQVWIKRRMDRQYPDRPGQTFFGARQADEDVHPISGMPAENCTRQMELPGPWHERLPHFRLEFTPSKGDELQSEYFVPRTAASSALMAVSAIGDRLKDVLFISEIRTIARDSLKSSPFFQRDTVALHFTWAPMWSAVQPVLRNLEATLRPFGVTAHAGKLSLDPTP
jgi:xylitol oxidase